MKRFLILMALAVIISPVLADKGLIVVSPVTVHESAQNAIIAWNGSYEILILSTKLESKNKTKVLEFIPLPSKPEVEKGNVKSFYAVTRLINEKIRKSEFMGMGAKSAGVEIVLRKQIGVHNITVVRVGDVEEFRSWVDKFLPLNRSINRIEDAVRYYVSNGFRYFVFDIVEVYKQRDVEPIVYKFESPFLFYPMRITAYSDVGESYSRINIFVITKGEPNVSKPFWVRATVEIDRNELEEIDKDIAKMFDRAYLTYATYNGYLNHADNDLIIIEAHIPPPSIKIARYFASLPIVKFLGIFPSAYNDIFGGIFATIILSAFFAGMIGIIYYMPTKDRRARMILAVAVATILLINNGFVFTLFASVSILLGFAVMVYTLEGFIKRR